MYAVESEDWPRRVCFCKISEKRNRSEGIVHQFAEETVDAPDECMGHEHGVDANDSELQQRRSTPHRTQSTLRRDRVDTGIQTEMDYQTSSGLRRLHSERQYRRSESPNQVYNKTVCLNALYPANEIIVLRYFK